MQGEHNHSSTKEHITIFEEYRNAIKLPPEEKTEFAIFQNSWSLVAAGIETTGYTLTTAHYHLLANPDCCRRLKQELASVWPDEDLDSIPPWTTLEKLPYVKAVLHESLRLSIGVMARLSRVNHHEPMKYKDW
jgi:cytochrome P450